MIHRKPILCVDFDGVVHSYTTPWIDEATIPHPPVPGAIKWLWRATEWFDVQIYSSRSKSDAGIQAMRLWMARNCAAEFDMEHPMNGSPFPIGFAAEKPPAFLTIDDRALCFEGNWSEIEPAGLLNFKPWNKRGPAKPLEKFQP
jgi:hypothetical protein